MTSPNKPTSKPSRVAKMSVKPIWRKKLNPCNTSNELNVNSPTPMPKPLTPHHEPSQENNHPNQALPNPYIKDTPTSPQVVSHPPFPISPINSHVTHTQAPPQSDNQTQHTPPLSPSRESLVDDINQLQDLSNLLAMHLSQQQNNIPSSPYSPNLPHTLNINQVETHVGCPYRFPLPAPSAFVTPATDIISPIGATPEFSRRSALLIRPGQAIPFGRPYRTHPNGSHKVLTVRKRLGPLPSYRLALRYTSHHSSSSDFTSDLLLDSPLDSSLDSSSDHSLSDHSLSDHSPKDSIEEDIDVGVPENVEVGINLGVGIKIDEGIGLDVEPSREDFLDLVSADGSLEVMQLGLDVAIQQLYDHMREIPVDWIASIETG
ncbi:hypothetical protein Tco_0744320 [Tanacetum coccineum]